MTMAFAKPAASDPIADGRAALNAGDPAKAALHFHVACDGKPTEYEARYWLYSALAAAGEAATAALVLQMGRPLRRAPDAAPGKLCEPADHRPPLAHRLYRPELHAKSGGPVYPARPRSARPRGGGGPSLLRRSGRRGAAAGHLHGSQD